MEEQYYEVYDTAWTIADREENELQNKFMSLPHGDSPAQVFKSFKERIGQLNYIWQKRDFIIDTLDTNNQRYIRGLIVELEEVINNPIVDSDIFIKEASDYAVNVYAKKKVYYESSLDKKRKILYLFALLKSDYFNDIMIPDEVFEFEDSPIYFPLIGEVYGTYFLFHDYLKSLIAISDEVAINPPRTTVEDLKRTKKVAQMKEQHLRDIWKEDKLIYFDKIIKELKTTLIFDVPCIKQEKEQLIWSDEIGKGSKSYLAGFFYACETASLLDSTKYEGSIPVIIKILKKTFGVSSTPSTYNTIKYSVNSDKNMYKAFFKPLISKVLKEI